MTDQAQSATAADLPLLEGGFKKIALSFSGGGFRAAAFSLGCASYLHQLRDGDQTLFEKVSFISSASGGTMTSLMLASRLKMGHSFAAVYDLLIREMSGTGIMDKVFEKLVHDEAWQSRPGKTRNLINAFALVYDEKLFNGDTFVKLFCDADTSWAGLEICANATEFNNGINFRFGTKGLIGNRFLNLKPVENGYFAAGKIKLGDILACSSCFPAGFEPVMFPQDFAYKSKEFELTESELNAALTEIDRYNGKETTRSASGNKVGFGFMDGGIDDNQGIYTFLTADNRLNRGFDAYFICDVSSNFVDKPFEYPAVPALPILQKNLTEIAHSLRKGASTYLFMCVALTVLSMVLSFFSVTRDIALVFLGICLMAIGGPLTAFLIMKNQLKTWWKKAVPVSGSAGSWGSMVKRYGTQLLHIPLRRLLPMILARISSVLMLAVTVYLKKIRRISYSFLYASKANDVYGQIIRDANESGFYSEIKPGPLWNNHIGACTVYRLSAKNDFKLREILGNPKLKEAVVSASDQRSVLSLLYPISEGLRDAANVAADMETTLWFDERQMKNKSLESLIVTGQATMCFCLIEMMYRYGNQDAQWMALRQKLIEDWEMFQKKPFSKLYSADWN